MKCTSPNSKSTRAPSIPCFSEAWESVADVGFRMVLTYRNTWKRYKSMPSSPFLYPDLFAVFCLQINLSYPDQFMQFMYMPCEQTETRGRCWTVLVSVSTLVWSVEQEEELNAEIVDCYTLGAWLKRQTAQWCILVKTTSTRVFWHSWWPGCQTMVMASLISCISIILSWPPSFEEV